MKANKGFTLIELAVVLAIIAVLAAILTPLVTSYIDQARTTRASADVRAIAQSYQLHVRDTGEYPIFTDAAAAATGTTADKEYFASQTADEPALATGGGAPNGWTNYTVAGTSASIDEFLNQNKLTLPTNNPGGGRVAYRGPYLDLTGALDPWGNAYIVTALNLVDDAANMGFVLSAGPDGLIDTDDDQVSEAETLTPGNDDIVSRIR